MQLPTERMHVHGGPLNEDTTDHFSQDAQYRSRLLIHLIESLLVHLVAVAENAVGLHRLPLRLHLPW